MRIKKIRIRNLYSIEDLTLDLENYKGITLIEGINKDAGGSNGSGKSSLIEAIFWGLTGKTIRKSNENAIVNNKSKKKCCVEIYLDNGALIRRQRKPTFLEFFVNDDNRTKDSVPTTQAEIEKELGFNYKSLLCTSFFGQHNSFSFLDATPEDKRSIINNFLNLGDLFDKRKIVKDLKASYYQEAKALLAVVTEHRRSLEGLVEKKDYVHASSQDYYERYDKKVLSLSLDDVLTAEDKERNRLKELKAYSKSIKEYETKIKQAENTLDPSTEEAFCEECYQQLPKLPADEVKKTLTVLRNGLDNSHARLEELENTSYTLEITSREYKEIQKFKDLQRDLEKYDELAEGLSKKINDTEKKRTHQEKMYNVMKFWEKVFSEQGIVRYIVRNILGFFNAKCNYYLSYLCGTHYLITFDEELNEKITTRGAEIQYISLSGGERRKINLAVLMALKDLFVLNSSYDADILFFDEIAENLDENGIDGLFSLLQKIKDTKDVFVITHNKYLRTNLDSNNRITMIKTDGVTTLAKD